MFHGIACALMLANFALAADEPKDAPAKKTPAELQGAWKLVSLEIDGKDAPYVSSAKSQPVLTVKDGKLGYGGEDIATLAADGTTTPRIFDFTLIGPKKSFEGIYTVEKDTLKVCLNGRSEGVKDRPKEFSTKDNEDLRLLVFQRHEPKEGDDKQAGLGFVGVAIGPSEDKNNVVVNDTIKGSPASKAGLKKGDVILKVGDTEVKEVFATVDLVRQGKPGRDLVFRIQRDDKDMDITVKVGLLPFEVMTRLE